MNEWIDKETRKPKATDADEQQCVIVWHDQSGLMVYHWKFAAESSYVRRWMPCPEKPEKKTGIWTDKRKRRPKKTDADVNGHVMVWHKYNGVMTYHWQSAIRSNYIQWWMPCPEKPAQVSERE